MAGRHAITFITDETGGDHGAALALARQEGLSSVEIRSIDGRNVLALSPAELGELGRQIADHGLSVAGIASPLLKWAAPGRVAAELGDQFGFDRAGRSLGELGRQAAAAAHALGTRNVRIFTYLTHAGFRLDDLLPALDELLALAEREDVVLHVENEPVCNIRSAPDLIAVVSRYDHPRLRALLDIGNLYYAGAEPQVAELAAAMPFVDHMHFKDYDGGRGRYAALGEGRIPYAEFLPRCLAAANGRALTLSVETHVPAEPLAATLRSLHHLTGLLARVDPSGGHDPKAMDGAPHGG